MMLTPLKRWLNEERKDKSIFDIVVYGSSVKGKAKPHDIDMVVIFKEGSLKERLMRIQTIKKKIKVPVDIKGIVWEELFQEGFFARAGILLEGISIFENKPFSSKLGFEGYTLFTYSLLNKNHTEKIKFNYVLRGRKREGIIQKLEGHHKGPGVILIPIRNSLEFEEVLRMHAIEYSKKNMLVER